MVGSSIAAKRPDPAPAASADRLVVRPAAVRGEHFALDLTRMRVREVMQRSVVTAEERDDLASALRVMTTRGFRHLPVLSEGSLVGVVSQSDIILQGPDGETPYDDQVGEVMSTPTETIHPDADISEAAALMAVQRVGCLPVVEDDRLVGIVTTSDMLTAATHCRMDPRRGPPSDVGSVMFPRPGAVGPDASLHEAITVMFQNGARHVAVIGSKMHVLGIISEGDVRRAIGSPLAERRQEVPAQLRTITVAEVMTPSPQTVRVDEPVEQVVDLLLGHGLWVVPVVDARGSFVGMASYLDIVRRLGSQ